MSGVDLIAAERERQIADEGWMAEHDNTHTFGELADAAACYAITPAARHADLVIHGRSVTDPPARWPWDDTYWKPNGGNRINELVKAGALIAAEIDRLQRATA